MLLGNRALLVLTSGWRGLVRLLELWQALVLPLGRPLVAQMLAGQDVAPLVESVIVDCNVVRDVESANRPDPEVVRHVKGSRNRPDPNVVRDVTRLANTA